MFYRVIPEAGLAEPEESDFPSAGRFVVHRHCDASGEHLDLRLEGDGFLHGFRVDGSTLDSERWATLKAPHGLEWLEKDGEAIRIESGRYAWESFRDDGGTLLLFGDEIFRRIRVERVGDFTPAVAEAICDSLSVCEREAVDAAGLIRDGNTARIRAVERLCGLGAELDGAAFDGALWRKTLDGLSLDEIHGQLRAFEVRFDVKHPPLPVSRPEALPEEGSTERRDAAMSIARERAPR